VTNLHLASFFAVAGCAVLGGALAECSSGGAGSGANPGWGTAEVKGTAPFPVSIVIADTDGYDAGPPPMVNVELAEDHGQLAGVPSCHLYGAHGDLVGVSVTIGFTSGSAAPLVTGPYPIVAACLGCDAGAHATVLVADWENEGGVYLGTSVARGVSGTATLTELDTTVAGTFDASVAGADGGSATLSGSFSGPLCVQQY
jgi:hypothetical protein